MADLEWNGARVRANVIKAAKRGIDMTMERASMVARRSMIPGGRFAPVHPAKLTIRTATLEDSIKPHTAAHERGREVAGTWGSLDVEYAIFHELGTSKTAARPFLRPAAAIEYPKLAGRIRGAYRRIAR